MNNPGLETSQQSGDLQQQLGRKRTDLESNATFLTFEPGLYAIDFRSNSSSMSDVGLPLPCARLEAVLSPSSPGRAFVSLTPDDGWLSRATTTAHVLVVGGRAGAVLTIYRPTDGMPMPEVYFRSMLAPETAQPPPSGPAHPSKSASPVDLGPSLMVHIEGQGDRTESNGDWVGDLHGDRSIEGFSLTAPPGLPPSALEYQGIMGEDWRTPWFEAGAYCGSRGLQLPMLGFRLRLVGDAAALFDCRASGYFARHGAVGPVGSGEDCSADTMPLTAMRVEIIAKAAAPAAPAAPAAAKLAANPVTEPTKQPRPRRPSKA